MSDESLAKEFQEAVKERSKKTGVGKLAGNTTLDDRGIYNDLKRTVLTSPSSLSRATNPGGVAPSSSSGAGAASGPGSQPSDTPSPIPGAPVLITTPSPKYTPSEVVVAVLTALQMNDLPSANHGIKVLFAFTSPASASAGSSAADFAAYIPTSKYSVLLNWDEKAFSKKISYSTARDKAYLDVRIRDVRDGAWSEVSWVLSSREREGGEVWLIDSMLVRPENKRGL